MVLLAILTFGALAGLIGLALALAAHRLHVATDPLVEHINAVLPQTQCAQCGYPGCRPYAAAITRGEADIHHCPPGGEATLRALAGLLDRDPQPLASAPKPPQVAVIDEDACIGCAICLGACPVDAILGAHQQMHTVLMPLCTGCELCVAPCPIDCITMAPVEANLTAWRRPDPNSPSKHADARS